LGQRRKKIAQQEEALAGEIDRTLKRAHGKVSVSRAAELLGVHRTTLYRVHPNGTKGTPNR
jgi:transcriptional regulator of acetoin/glycerol metabolism